MDQNAMIEAWRKASSPGAMHERLEPLIGTWDTQTRVWFGPGDPIVTKTRVTKEWALGGRFVLQDYAGEETSMGRFFGMGLLGYNNISKRYQSVWMDTMSTAMLIQTGDWVGEALTLVGDQHESISLGIVRVRSVTRIVSDDRHTFENFVTGPDGKEMRTLEVVHSRV
ncbi:MAG: DUF1579 family protein [Phycisphaeraceae bacterium]|nr:DUF1579 family protein [Phycisphaeraceae bacterium]MCB9847059.1 DUF1579 family protein [Phycisphaeraceae bacterium]